jgi:hypothetical protein
LSPRPRSPKPRRRPLYSYDAPNPPPNKGRKRAQDRRRSERDQLDESWRKLRAERDRLRKDERDYDERQKKMDEMFSKLYDIKDHLSRNLPINKRH